MTDTRTRILETALLLFNERGIHNVGVREIARELGMSPGNLQYHFNKKDDLVAALIEELHAENTRLMSEVSSGPVDFTMLRELGIRIMRNHLTYRSVMLSYPAIVACGQRLRELERELVPRRRRRWDHMVEALVTSGLVDRDRVVARADYLFEQGSHLGRNWLSSAVLIHEADDLEAAIAHHLKLTLQLWEPYATDLGAKELTLLLDGSGHAVV